MEAREVDSGLSYQRGQEKHAQMGVQIQGAPSALDKGNRTGVGALASETGLFDQMGQL